MPIISRTFFVILMKNIPSDKYFSPVNSFFRFIMINWMFLRDISLLLLYIFTSLLALIGNGFVCRLSFQQKSSCNLPFSTTRIFLLNLALADALSGLSIPMQLLFCSKSFLNSLPISSHLCVLSKSLQILAYNTSTLTICVIAFDRYRMIDDPLQQYYHRHMRRSICFTWIASALFASTCLISMRVHTYFISMDKLISCQVFFPNVFSDLIRTIRVFCLMMFFYLLPLIILIILCILTMRILARRTIIGVQQLPKFHQSRTRSIRLLIVIVTVFALSHLPVHCFHLRDFFITSSKSHKCNDTTIYLFFYWLSISSCCHNPILYSWFNRQFRRLIIHCIKKIFLCQ